MTDKNSHQDSSVESENETVESGDDTLEDDTLESEDDALESEDDAHVSPEILAESIRSKTDALHAQGFDLADQLERMAEAEEGDDADETDETEENAADADDEETEVNLAGMMTELLETASDLVEVAHAIEAARLRDRSK